MTVQMAPAIITTCDFQMAPAIITTCDFQMAPAIIKKCFLVNDLADVRMSDSLTKDFEVCVLDH